MQFGHRGAFEGATRRRNEVQQPAAPAPGSRRSTTDDASSPAHGSAANGSTAHGSTAIGSTAHGSTENGSTENGSAANGSTAHGSTVNGSTAIGSTENGSTAHGSTANGSTARGSTARAARARALRDLPPSLRRRPPRDPHTGRWVAALVLALLVHALLVLLLWRVAPLTKPFEPPPDPRPMVVELRELEPDGDDGLVDEADGRDPDERLEQPQEAAPPPAPPTPPAQPIHRPPPDPQRPPEPVETPPEPAPADAPTPTAPALADAAADEAPPQRQLTAQDIARRRHRPFTIRPRAPIPPTAPRGVCNTSYTTCVYDSGDELQLGRAAAAAMANRAGVERMVAVSDAELAAYRSARRPAVAAPTHDTGMPVYSNYGTVQHKVDVARLSAAAAGAPYSCSIYPNALNDVDQDPDALVILVDSSGSMIHNMYTSPATRCAFAAAESALAHGIDVSVINFSDKLYVTEPTDDEQRIAEVICKQQKQDTLLPETELDDLIDDDGRRDLMLISDGRIANRVTAFPHLADALQRHPANQGYAVLLDNDVFARAIRDDLHAIGFRVTLLRF